MNDKSLRANKACLWNSCASNSFFNMLTGKPWTTNYMYMYVSYTEEKIPKIFLDFLIQKGFDILSINHFEKYLFNHFSNIVELCF